jgi:transmembrane sensor
MHITKELLERVFKNECSAEELEQVMQHIKDKPEDIEKFLDDREWEYFEQAEKLHPAVSEKLLQQIGKATYKKTATIQIIRRSMAAAVVVLLAGAGWIYFTGRATNTPPVLANKEQPAIVQPKLQYQLNNTEKDMRVVLADGSTVVLAANSQVAYYDSFALDNKRRVYLKGQAFFEVAKDKSKPFIVYSGDISTTAVGTSFTIQAFEKDNFIKVRLHTGKVLVKDADSLQRHLTANMYMDPGNVLVYDKLKMTATIERRDKEAIARTTESKQGNDAALPNWYMFNNQSLAQVFDQLQELYGVTIDYPKNDVRKMYFIGRFQKSDSLEVILNDIALLNKLKVIKQGNTYIIRKKQH